MSSQSGAAPTPSTPTPPSPAPPADPIVAYEFGPFKVDVAGRHLLKDGSIVPLTAKVFDTLLVLVRNHDRPVMKEELIQAVWPGSFVSDDSLVQNISALRRALGDDSSQPTYIATLARRGYRFIAPTTAHTVDGTTTTSAAPETPAPASIERPAAPPSFVKQHWRWAAAAFAIGLAVASIVAVAALRAGDDSTAAPRAFRFQEPIPPELQLRGNAVASPDGRQIAFAAQDGSGLTHIWVRSLDAPEARQMPGTEGGTSPFWAQDGQSLGFAVAGEMKRVSLATGTVQGVAPTHRVRPLGASWGPNDTILYSDVGQIFSVPLTGRKGTILVDSGPSGQLGELRYPQWLSDGRHFVFYASGGSGGDSGTYLATADGRRTTRILAGYRATYAPPDYLLYVRDRTLMAQKFNPDAARLEGAPMALPGNVSPSADISGSGNGVLTISESQAQERLVWFDRTGQPLSSIALPRPASDIVLSPDEKQLLAAALVAGTYELWLIDLERQVSTKVADDGTFAAWSPDGTRFAYTLVGGQGADLHLKSLARDGAADVALLKTEELKSVNSWSPDGSFIVYNKYGTRDQTSQDLWILPTTGDEEPRPFVQTRAREREAAVSPAGGLVAYTSDETGTDDVYLQTFPSAGLKVRVSVGGGTQPAWRGDGRELYYVAADRRLMAVPISRDGVPGQARPLFRLPALGSTRQYAPSRDGQRFIALDWDPSQQQQRNITVLTNWEAMLRP